MDRSRITYVPLVILVKLLSLSLSSASSSTTETKTGSWRRDNASSFRAELGQLRIFFFFRRRRSLAALADVDGLPGTFSFLRFFFFVLLLLRSVLVAAGLGIIGLLGSLTRTEASFEPKRSTKTTSSSLSS